MHIPHLILSDTRRCIIQITPGRQCHNDAEKPLVYKGNQIMVCSRCYEIIMDKLAKRLRTSDNGTRRKGR